MTKPINQIKIMLIHKDGKSIWKIYKHLDTDVNEKNEKYYRALFLENTNNGMTNEPFRIKFDDYEDFLKCQLKNGYKIMNRK